MSPARKSSEPVKTEHDEFLASAAKVVVLQVVAPEGGAWVGTKHFIWTGSPGSPFGEIPTPEDLANLIGSGVPVVPITYELWRVNQ